jgi:hypothetical protein
MGADQVAVRTAAPQSLGGRNGLIMEWNLRSRLRGTDLIACSLCLRVQRGSAWVEAEDVIRELRSYEFPATPRLRPGMCDACADAILGRRARRVETLAA